MPHELGGKIEGGLKTGGVENRKWGNGYACVRHV